MTKTILAQVNWGYTLYQTDSGKVLTVACGTVGIYEVSILLSEEECRQLAADDKYVERLAARVSGDPHGFIGRSVPNP